MSLLLTVGFYIIHMPTSSAAPSAAVPDDSYNAN